MPLKPYMNTLSESIRQFFNFAPAIMSLIIGVTPIFIGEFMPNLEFPMIETQRLLLNKLTKHDREPLLAIFSDPKIIEHYDVARFKSIEDSRPSNRVF